MENKSFDDIIKSKLEQFNIEPDSAAWSEFEKFSNEAGFDAQIKHELDGFHLEEFPHDWDVLNEKLVEPEEVNSFDMAIGAMINSASFAEDADWDTFEKILDSEDLTFDRQVSQKVKNHEVSSAGNQWPKLSARIEEIERRKRRIVITKFVEAAIFILFIITLMQLYPIQNISKNKVYRTFAVDRELNRSDRSFVDNKAIDTGIKQVENISNQEITTVANAVYAEIIGQTITSERSDLNAASLKRPIKEIESVEVLAVPEIDHSFNIVNLQVKMTSPEDLWAFDNKDVDQRKNMSNEFTAFERSKSSEYLLASIDVPLIEFHRKEPAFFPNVLRKDAKKGQYWLNTFGSPDINFINTPYDHVYGIPAYQSQSIGYSVGTSISYETDNWEVDGGLVYSSLNVGKSAPEEYKVVEVTGNYWEGFKATSLKEFVMDIVQIPLNFKYKLFDNKSWSIYSSAGVSSALIMNANYNIGEDHVYPVASRRPGTGTSPQESGQVRVTGTLLNEKDFDKGLLNQGELLNNIFFTLNTGVGVSKSLNDNAKFFVEPTYHYNLSVGGIGPNNDVHHRLGVQIGTKIKL